MRSKSPINTLLGGHTQGGLGDIDSLGFGHAGGAGNRAPGKPDSSLLGDWRNFSADKLVLLGQEPMSQHELVKDKGMRISGPGHPSLVPSVSGDEMAFQLAGGEKNNAQTT